MPMILLHLVGEDPVLGEIEELPSPNATSLLLRSPRKRDGKDLHYLDANVTTVIWPMARVNFIEVLPTGEEEEVIGFVRE
jgi:hypothetical protein